MDNINIANDLWDCYWFIDDVFETNMHETIDDAMKNKFVGTFSSYADKSAMFKIANNLYNNKLGLACIGLKNYLTGKLKEFDMNSFVPDRLCDLIEKLRRIDVSIPLNICGRCHAKAHKEYYIARKVCWLWSSKQMKLIKVINMDIKDVKENLEYFLKDVK